MSIRCIHPARAALVLLGLVGLAVAAGGQSYKPDETGTPEGPPALNEILASKTDLLGEIALNQPDGPRYEFFANAMPSLRYVNAAFRHYPIVLAAPRNACKARLVSNGSAINAAGGGNAWNDPGFPVTFHVGPRETVFGDDPANLDGPRLAEGYLPIIEMTYREGAVSYRQESFVSTDPDLADHGVVFVRFALDTGQLGNVAAQVAPSGPVHLDGYQLCDDGGRVLVRFGANWQWDPDKRMIRASITPHEDALLAVFTDAADGTSPALSPGQFSGQRQQCAESWRQLLGKGVRLEVPEPVVNTAWRAVLGANFAIITGNTVNYSAGNAYETEYITEGSRTVGAFLLFGFPGESQSMLLSLLNHSIPEHKYAVTGWKLRALAQYYWLTRDDAFMREHRSCWEALIALIVDGLDPRTGLTPQDFYATDIPKPVWNLKTNATCWRGLRDMAAVRREMGEPDPELETRAAQYRQSILDAVAKSADLNFTPPFVPNALLEALEQPYEALTASRLGSYWCLVSNAVLDSGVFDAQPEKAAWILDTLHQRGGVCMGMLRFDQHSGLFANERGLDDNYTTGYTLHLLKQDNADRALVGFYGKLAQGFTRDTFVGGEGTGLDPLDRYGRPMYLPPCTAGNAFFLWTLRHLLVQDWDEDDDGTPDTLRLLYAVPRYWLRDGAVIRFENAPTAFGPLSLETESNLNRGEFLVRVNLPQHPPENTRLRARLPKGWKAVRATVGDTGLSIDESGGITLSGYTGHTVIRFEVQQQSDR